MELQQHYHCTGHTNQRIYLTSLGLVSQVKYWSCLKIHLDLLFCSPVLLSQSCLNINTGVERPPRHVHMLLICKMLSGSCLALRTVTIDSIISKYHYLGNFLILSEMPQAGFPLTWKSGQGEVREFYFSAKSQGAYMLIVIQICCYMLVTVVTILHLHVFARNIILLYSMLHSSIKDNAYNI